MKNQTNDTYTYRMKIPEQQLTEMMRQLNFTKNKVTDVDVLSYESDRCRVLAYPRESPRLGKKDVYEIQFNFSEKTTSEDALLKEFRKLQAQAGKR